MRLVSYRATIEHAARLGALVDDFVVDLGRLGEKGGEPLPATMLEFIDMGPLAVEIAAALLEKQNWPLGGVLPLSNVRLLAPIPRPRKNIFGIGLNYLDHVAESAKALETSPDLPKQPVIFSKPPTTVIGPGEPIPHDATITRQLDWEVELGVVMGIGTRRVSRADALRHVFGYTVLIDISPGLPPRGAMDLFQGTRWLRAYGPLHRDAGRDSGSADPRSLA